MAFAPIHHTLLVRVTGGTIQWDPGLMGTMSSLAKKKRTPNPSPQMQQAVKSLGDAFGSFGTLVKQSQEQGSQALMQMLPQLMQR